MLYGVPVSLVVLDWIFLLQRADITPKISKYLKRFFCESKNFASGSTNYQYFPNFIRPLGLRGFAVELKRAYYVYRASCQLIGGKLVFI